MADRHWHTIPLELGEEVWLDVEFSDGEQRDLITAYFGSHMYHIQQDRFQLMKLRLVVVDGETCLQVFGWRQEHPSLEMQHEGGWEATADGMKRDFEDAKKDLEGDKT